MSWNTRPRTILKICFTFVSSAAEQNTSGEFITFAYRFAIFVIFSRSDSGSFSNESYFVPTKNGKALRFNVEHCLNHCFTLLSVVRLVRSNMYNTIAASAHTIGSILWKSRWPPKSHTLKVTGWLPACVSWRWFLGLTRAKREETERTKFDRFVHIVYT